MSQHLLKSPDTVAVTDQIQAVTLPEQSCWYSIRNAGTADVYYISISTDGYTAATYNDKTAAVLRTAGCGMVKSGETLAFFTDHPHIYLVCADGLTATANVEPGILSQNPTLTAGDIEIGAVEIKNAASDVRALVSPANTARAATNNVISVQNLDDTGKVSPAAGTGVMAAAQAVTLATDDTQLGAVGAAADPDGNIHGQLRSIAERNESAGQTIIYADINANATVGATPEEIIALVGSEKFYVLELVLTFTAQDIVRLLSKTGTPVYWGTYQVAARGGIVLLRNANDRPHFVSTTAGENLGIVTAATNSYSGHIIYYTA